MAKICLCLTAKTIGRNLEILDRHRSHADIAELRVDCLDPDERFLIRRFPEQAGIPVILTIRRNRDGGQFIGGEGARINLMARGLAFADENKRRNFAYLDVEEDLNVPSLEEAARTFGTKIIRSIYYSKETDTNLSAIIRSVKRSGEEIVKLAVTARSISDVYNLLRAGKECREQEKILFATGRYSALSGILAEKFGSFMCYAYAPDKHDTPEPVAGAFGQSSPQDQIDIRDLAELYRFRNITLKTRIFGVVGFPLNLTGSSYFFNTVFKHEDLDAVYVPFPADSIVAFMKLADELGIEGLSVATPYKEAVIPFLSLKSLEVMGLGTCNTLTRCPKGWYGTNMETQGFSDSVLNFTGRTNLKRQRVTLIGAGCVAKATALELDRLGAKVLILNRTIHKARDFAIPYKFAWGGLDSKGAEMTDRYRDLIIQATPAGTSADMGRKGEGYPEDILEIYRFCGREKVMDLVYKPTMTFFLKRAANAGCKIISGYDMFIRQARYQYTAFTGRDFPEYLLERLQWGRD